LYKIFEIKRILLFQWVVNQKYQADTVNYYFSGDRKLLNKRMPTGTLIISYKIIYYNHQVYDGSEIFG